MLSNVVNHVVAMSESGGGTSSLDNVLGIIPTTMSLSGKMLDAVIANPIYLLFFSVPIVGIGVTILGMIRRAASGRR